MSKFPIGATWEIKEKQSPHRTGHIILTERNEHFEVWNWSWTYSDGSTAWYHSDWCTSYATARNELLLHGRARRIK